MRTKSSFGRINLHLCDEAPGMPADSLLHNYQKGNTCYLTH